METMMVNDAGCLVCLNLVFLKGIKSEQTPTRCYLYKSTILQGGGGGGGGLGLKKKKKIN
jgi:hypothetical protein